MGGWQGRIVAPGPREDYRHCYRSIHYSIFGLVRVLPGFGWLRRGSGRADSSRAEAGAGGRLDSQLQEHMTADLSELFEQYYESLVRMLYRRTGDRDRAEDLAQETFARAVAAPPNNPRPWLFAVALNLVREDGRRSVRQGRRLELLRADDPAPEGPAEEFDRNERSAAVRSALATLNERDREALLLKAEGFNYEEIAATLGLSKGAIGTTLARARRRLVEAYRVGGLGKNVAS